VNRVREFETSKAAWQVYLTEGETAMTALFSKNARATLSIEPFRDAVCDCSGQVDACDLMTPASNDRTHGVRAPESPLESGALNVLPLTLRFAHDLWHGPSGKR
jgi:hypothetical protein